MVLTDPSEVQIADHREIAMPLLVGNLGDRGGIGEGHLLAQHAHKVLEVEVLHAAIATASLGARLRGDRKA
ncbi:MAG: hypothetical protein WAV32_03665 [Halobacteriota archaeon]